MGVTTQPTPSSKEKGQRKRGRERENRGGAAAKLSAQLDRVIDGFESSSANSGSADDATSIKACVDELKNLPGLQLESELFFIGTRLMNKRANKLAFVAFEDPALQLGWIKSHTWISTSTDNITSIESSSKLEDRVTKNEVLMLVNDITRPVDPSFRDIPDEIRNDSRYYPYFKDCIGAIDGNHIRVCVPPHLQIAYVGRKGYTTNNVLAACDFNMCFTFVSVGWEGSAHDSKIFMEALHKPRLHFPHPPQGKYYLVDAGYPKYYLVYHYKKNRYHLPEFRNGPRIRGRVEVFNYYHSSVRSTTERSSGCCKARWKILGNMPPFALKIQSKIIAVCMALHNFIRRNDTSEVEFDAFDENYQYEHNDDGEGNETDPSTITWEEPDAQSALQMELIRVH